MNSLKPYTTARPPALGRDHCNAPGRSDWLNRCIAEGKLLPDAPFRVVRSQKLGMGNFFGSPSSSSPTPACSQKENKREAAPKRRPSSSGNSAARLSTSGEGRQEEEGPRGSRSRGGAGSGGGVAVSGHHAAAVKSSNGYGDCRRRGRDAGLSTSGDTSKRRGSSNKRARTSSSRAGYDGLGSRGSDSARDWVDREERESDARTRAEAQ